MELTTCCVCVSPRESPIACVREFRVKKINSIFQTFPETFWKILTGSIRRLQKYIYMMVLQLITIFKKISGNPRKLSENLDGLDQMILKIYVCWGIVADTNFQNEKESENF